MRKTKGLTKRTIYALLTGVITVSLMGITPTMKNVEAACSRDDPFTNRIYFGNYWQNDTNGDGVVDTSDDKEPIVWRVLSNSDNKVLLLADQNLDARTYHDSQEAVDWANCDLRAWLNGTFYENAFTEEEQAAIQESTIVTRGDAFLGTKDVTTRDKVYVPSVEDVTSLSYGFISCNSTKTDYSRVATNTYFTATKDYMYAGGEDDVYWLRNVGQDSCIMTVLIDGICDYHTPSDYVCGVRPMLELDISDTDLWSSAISGSAEIRNLTVSGQLNYDYAYEVLDIVNETRAAAGVGELTMDEELLETAMQRAAELTVYYSHTRPNGEECFSLFRPSTNCMTGPSENIAMGQISPEEVMTAWNNSPGHYANIINYKSKSIGIGCFVDSNGKCYWVQCFDGLSAVDSQKNGTETTTYTVPTMELLIRLCTEQFCEIDCDDKTKEVQMKVRSGAYDGAEIDASNFEYSSSDTTVADVDEKGLITFKKAGKVVITAALNENTSIKVTKTITKYDHSYTSKVVEPTYTEQGYTRHSCSECGDYYDDKFTPVLEKPAEPEPSESTTGQTGNEQPATDQQENEQPTTEQSATTDTLPVVGTVKELSTGTYKITKSSSTEKEVTYVKPNSKKKTSVTIPATVSIDGQTYKVTEIAAKAFKNNKKLKSVTIGKNVKKIGKETFSGCKKLNRITIKSTVLTSVGKNAIKNIKKNATIKVPKKQLKAYKKLFKSKTGYKKTMKVKK